MAAAFFTADGIVESACAGVRKAGSPVRVTKNDLWHLGSDTKVMTSTLAGTFVAEGTLSWDSKVASFFPEFGDRVDPALRDVTFGDLLAHRSGLVENLDWSGFAAKGGSIKAQRHAAAQQAMTSPPAYPVGQFHYANTNYVVAGAVLERISGVAWEDLIKERLFKPLEMASAGFGGVGTPGQIDQPWGHYDNGSPSEANGPLADNPPVMGPAGRVHVSVVDWCRFLSDQLRGAAGKPALLPADIYAAIQTPQEGFTYAYGWGVSKRPWAGGKALSHAGSNTMNYALCWLAPNRQFGAVVCANQASEKAKQACDKMIGILISRFQNPASASTGTEETTTP